VVGAFVAAPLAAFVWCLIQPRFDHAQTATQSALPYAVGLFRRHIATGVPNQRAEVVVVSGSSLVGTLIGQSLSPDAITQAATLVLGAQAGSELSAAWLLAVIPILTVILGQFGCNPLLSVSVLAAALPSPEALGVSPALWVLTLTGSWNLVAGSSPFTGACLISARTASTSDAPHSARSFGLTLNGMHTLIQTLVLAGVLYALAS
ncbi:MAG: hypothetical protein ACPGYL_13610, partial [Rhodospirillaceae bacterium]